MYHKTIIFEASLKIHQQCFFFFLLFSETASAMCNAEGFIIYFGVVIKNTTTFKTSSFKLNLALAVQKTALALATAEIIRKNFIK